MTEYMDDWMTKLYTKIISELKEHMMRCLVIAL